MKIAIVNSSDVTSHPNSRMDANYWCGKKELVQAFFVLDFFSYICRIKHLSMYTIFKFAVPFTDSAKNNYQVGDDIIASAPPYMPQAGIPMPLWVEGEVYGSGFTGQIAQVPLSVLTKIADNVDATGLSNYINYQMLPTPESNPSLSNINPTTMSTGMPVNTVSAPAQNNLAIAGFLLFGFFIIYALTKSGKKSE